MKSSNLTKNFPKLLTKYVNNAYRDICRERPRLLSYFQYIRNSICFALAISTTFSKTSPRQTNDTVKQQSSNTAQKERENIRKVTVCEQFKRNAQGYNSTAAGLTQSYSISNKPWSHNDFTKDNLSFSGSFKLLTNTNLSWSAVICCKASLYRNGNCRVEHGWKKGAFLSADTELVF